MSAGGPGRTPGAGGSSGAAASGRPVLRFLRLRPGSDADIPLPCPATAGSAGLDLPAAVTEPLVLEPGARALVPTGFAIALPPGCEGQVRPRSGLALRHGITMLNSPGTIDEDYRGEVKVIVANLGQESFTIERGMRIAQLVVSRVVQTSVTEVDTLPDTDRGEGGFGHTGH